MRALVMTSGLLVAALLAAPLEAQERVQDVARMHGQRTNNLMGYGLVVGLNGTGDGGKSASTLRALAAMHRRFAQDVLNPVELRSVGSVALVAVEAVVPEYGAREGQALDVRVSTVGEAKSLRGGRLLTTPLQYAMFDPQRPETQRIFALAAGAVEVEGDSPTTGIIRGGAVLEADFFYNFLDGDSFTLVLNDTEAGFPMAHAVANAISLEVSHPAEGGGATRRAGGEAATALGPRNVRVRIPHYELERPASFIRRVLETVIFEMPEQPARVTINRRDRQVVVSPGAVVAPTILYIPRFGSIVIGQPEEEEARDGAQRVPLNDLLTALSQVNVPPDQVVRAIESLHRSGHLHAQLVYRE